MIEHKITRRISIAAYLVIGLFTFGYGSMHHQCRGDDNNFNVPPCFSEKGFIGFVDAAMWPLYWSWEVQERP
jgi:hypothetical protein